MEKIDVVLGFKKLREGAKLPEYNDPSGDQMDVFACMVPGVKQAVILPGSTALIGTGLACEIPPGWMLAVRPRGSVSLKTELVIKNSPGTVDTNYRDEIKVIFRNNDFLNNLPITIKHGDKIAQLVLERRYMAEIKEIKEFSNSADRGGGFGSSD